MLECEQRYEYKSKSVCDESEQMNEREKKPTAMKRVLNTSTIPMAGKVTGVWIFIHSR